jgi:carboxypeptidase family protein
LGWIAVFCVSGASNMKKIGKQALSQKRACKTALWILCAAAGLGVADGQTGSVQGTVDAPSAGVPLTGAKVVVIDRKSGTVAGKKVVENGQYEIALKPGSYEVFACDRHLEYEPYSRHLELRNGTSIKKDLHLIKKPLTVPAVDEEGKLIGPKVVVCLRHLESTCEAETSTDAKGEIVIPGPEAHFEVQKRGEQPCE